MNKINRSLVKSQAKQIIKEKDICTVCVKRNCFVFGKRLNGRHFRIQQQR